MNPRTLSVFVVLFFLGACAKNEMEPAPNQPVENQPPEILSLTAMPDTVILNDSTEANDSTLVTCLATDPEGGEVDIDWRLASGRGGGGGGLKTASYLPDNVAVVTPRSGSSLNITCVAIDSDSATANETIVIGIVGGDQGGIPTNHAPVIDSLIVDKDHVTVNEVVNLMCYAHDQDGDSLLYEWVSYGISDAIFEEQDQPNFIKWHAQQQGDYQVWCNVRENKRFNGRRDAASLFIRVD